MNSLNFIFIAIAYTIVIQHISAFIPADIIENVFQKLDKLGYKKNDYYADTTTHDQIISYGIAQSVVEYFISLPNGSLLINRTADEYHELRNLYHDYYGVWLCDLPVDELISYTFKPSVAQVDLDPDTKDFPYAHFDAETFLQSNERVIAFKNQIYTALNKFEYNDARMLAGQILHTIQDFYSHSNWVEMGKTDINYNIGFQNFSISQPIILPNDTDPCYDNCLFVSLPCSTFLSVLTTLLNKFKLTTITCPIQYYKCPNNTRELTKLVSGYYGGQKLEDGTSYLKPPNLNKCSHGGILDKSTNISAKGGINKDTGYYILSPHADRHTDAVKLAIKHTKFFFEDIRAKIGNERFATFLKLTLSPEKLAQGNTTYFDCFAFRKKNTLFSCIINVILVYFLSKYF